MDSGGRTGVLVIRVWLEGGSDSSLRARISAARDEAPIGTPDEVVAAGLEPIVEHVRAWLEQFAAAAAPDR